MTYDELSEHLNALQRDDCYRVDTVMKEGPYERTEKVYFVGANGSEQGPYVRKIIKAESGLGSAYECIFQAQKNGRRFSYLPRVAECYSTGSDRVVVMEYVYGETLQDVVYRCDPSVALAVDLFPKLCKAVEELHAAFSPPLIHRDLKPSNVMVSRDSLTIIDFGITRTYRDGADADTKHFGTRAYAPPEQFGFGQTDVRSDVYALGMLLYFCLTEKTPDAKARAHAFAAPAVPEVLRMIIQKAVELDPVDRYQTVAELLAAFDRATAEPAYVLSGARYRNEASGSAGAGHFPSAPAAPQSPPIAFPGSVRSSMPPGAGGSHLRQAGGPLSRIPVGLGIAWDIVVLFVLCIFLAATVGLIASPDPTAVYAGYPLAKRIVLYGSLFVFFFVPLAYFVSDRRPLKKMVPALGKLTVPKDALILLGGFALAVIIIVACTAL